LNSWFLGVGGAGVVFQAIIKTTELNKAIEKCAQLMFGIFCVEF
jgi:hypothetical protein